MYFDYFVSNVIMLCLMVVLLVSNKLEMMCKDQDVRGHYFCWMVPRFRPLVFHIRIVLRWRWLRSVDGVILTGKNWGTRRSSIPFTVAPCPPQIAHGLALYRTRGLCSERPWPAIADQSRISRNKHLKIQCLSHNKHLRLAKQNSTDLRCIGKKSLFILQITPG
jgi:hypothetical protein